MNTLFNREVSLHAVLYILKLMGGECDMHKICKILYFADQKHLSRYARSITGDDYIRMTYGPVPSKIDDMFKAVRGDSYFSDSQMSQEIASYFCFKNRFLVQSKKEPEMDFLSETDVECLDESISQCKDMSFGELTEFSHGPAWQNTQQDRKISVKDIIREAGDTEEYVKYVAQKLELESSKF